MNPIAYIEARETCTTRPHYGVLVVPGAMLWLGEGATKTPAKRIIAHASQIEVLSRDSQWTHFLQGDITGYVQSFFVVDYDPSVEIRPAVGERFAALC